MHAEDKFVVPQAEVEADLAFLREKLANSTESVEQARLMQQITLMEDAVVVYKLTRSSSHHL